MSLIIHADDLGETKEISLGIFQCIKMGTVTSTSILANMPATDFALSAAEKCLEEISFGVHLNLCEGNPLTRPKTLVQSNGIFLKKKELALNAFIGLINLDEVEKEMNAQIERVHKAGIKISHLDSHKHLHQLPGINKVATKLAVKYGIKRIRCTIEKSFWPQEINFKANVSRFIRSILAKRASRNFKNAFLRHPDQVFDIKELILKKNYEQRLELLNGLKGITEMFCHPGTAKADKEKPGSCNRYSELQFLLSGEFRSLIKETPVELKTFWDC